MNSTSFAKALPALLLAFACSEKVPVNQNVLRLHPQNSHYFMFNGKPTVLISSAEHYGAVMNADFDFVRYLETLEQAGFNYTRIFIGPYSEMGSNNFGISNNTMDPKPDKWLTPWMKDSSTQKYDLTSWNQAFFNRLKAFVSLASEKGIVVEVTLFTSFYVNNQWQNSPFYFRNNSNALDSIPFVRANTLYNSTLMDYQERYVRKIIQELNSFNNIFFEIQNEPWSDNPNLAGYKNETDNKTYPNDWQKKAEIANNVSLEWQDKIASIIHDEEMQLSNKHLVAQNICNFGIAIQSPNPTVSIFNFHYAHPEAASENLDKQAAMALDETGFMPHNDFLYRSQAWKFILAGGALYNNLDYSFVVGKEDGTHPIDDRTPGWGGSDYRNQVKVLKDFIESFEFTNMRPDNSLLKEKEDKDGIEILAENGKQYAIYIHGGNKAVLSLEIPDGNYRAEWVNPLSGAIVNAETVVSKNTTLVLPVPPFKEDIAVRLIKNAN